MYLYLNSGPTTNDNVSLFYTNTQQTTNPLMTYIVTVGQIDVQTYTNDVIASLLKKTEITIFSSFFLCPNLFTFFTNSVHRERGM